MEAMNEKLSRGGVLRIDPATIQNVRRGTEMVATIATSAGGAPELLSLSGNDDNTGFVTVDLTDGNSYELIDEILATPDGGNVCSATDRLVAAMKAYQLEILSRQPPTV